MQKQSEGNKSFNNTTSVEHITIIQIDRYNNTKNTYTIKIFILIIDIVIVIRTIGAIVMIVVLFAEKSCKSS